MTTQELVALIKKRPVGFGGGVLSLALAAAIYFRGDAIPETETQLAEKSAVAERYTLNFTNSAQLKEQLEEMVAANKTIEARTIHASQLGLNTGLFHKLVKDTGVTLVSFQQTTSPTVGKPTKTSFVPVGFNVSVQGSLVQVLEFLRALEGGAHYSRMLSANLSGNAANRTAPLTLSLSLEILGQP
jgi:hypothetical protein